MEGCCLGIVVNFLLEFLILAWHTLLYLASEIFTFGAVITTGVCASHTIKSIIKILTHYQLGDFEETLAFLLLVRFVIYPRLRTAFITFVVQRYQDQWYPKISGILRLLLLLLIFLAGVYATLQTYYNRHSDVGHIKADAGNLQLELAKGSSQYYSNDVAFLASITTLMYFSERVLMTFGDFLGKKAKLDCGMELNGDLDLFEIRNVTILFTTLFLLELFKMTFCIVLHFLIQAFFAEFYSLEKIVLTYLILCTTGLVVGFISVIFDSKVLNVSRQLFQGEKFISCIHWRAREVVLFFCFPPLLFSYLANDECGFFCDEKSEEQSTGNKVNNYVLVSSLLATFLGQMVYYQIRFSQMFCDQNRVHPRNIRWPWPPSGRRAILNVMDRFEGDNDDDDRCSFLCGYIPINLTQQLRNMEKTRNAGVNNSMGERVEGRNQDGSISTGTCTSLMNRMNNNNESLTTSKINNSNGSLIAQTSIQIDRETEIVVMKATTLETGCVDLTGINVNNNNTEDEILLRASTREESVPVVPSEAIGTENPIQGSNPPEVSPLNHQEPQDSNYKLKRCPSNLPF